jgi:hypothetical protein
MKPQHSPLYCPLKLEKYGKDAQLPLPVGESPKLDKAGITHIQQINGLIFYLCAMCRPI